MSRFYQILIVLIGLQCSSLGYSAESTKVRLAMAEFMDSLSQLMPYMTTRSDLSADERKAFNKLILKFTKASHDIDEKDPFVDQDPALRFVATRFRTNMDRVKRFAEKGKLRHARNVLKSTMGFCIACHSRTERGVSFDGLPNPKGFKKLGEFDKGNYMAATRQFDRAVLHYEKALKDKKLSQQKPWAWQLAIKRQLAITIRVKKDPNLALELLTAVREQGQVPASLVDLTKMWRVDAKAWGKEKKSKPSVSKLGKLVQEGEKRDKGQTDAGLIYFLRASSLAHDLLAKKKPKKSDATVFYYAGVSSENLGELNIWNLFDVYYESCIRTSPKSAISKKCYGRMEQAISPPNAEHTSDEDAKRLAELKKIAFGAKKKN